MKNVIQSYFSEYTLAAVTFIKIRFIKILTNEVFLEPILSIMNPIIIAPTTSPIPNATIPNNAYE